MSPNDLDTASRPCFTINRTEQNSITSETDCWTSNIMNTTSLRFNRHTPASAIAAASTALNTIARRGAGLGINLACSVFMRRAIP